MQASTCVGSPSLSESQHLQWSPGKALFDFCRYQVPFYDHGQRASMAFRSARGSHVCQRCWCLVGPCKRSSTHPTGHTTKVLSTQRCKDTCCTLALSNQQNNGQALAGQLFQWQQALEEKATQAAGLLHDYGLLTLYESLRRFLNS